MKKWTFIAIFVFLIVIAQSVFIYTHASKPISAAQQTAISIAKNHVKLNEIIEVTFFNGDEPYQVIRALDEQDEEIIIWVREQKPDDIIIEKASNGLTENEVKTFASSELDVKKLQTIRIGMKYNIPVWEITFIDSNDRYSFYYLHFNGETWIENYRLKAI